MDYIETYDWLNLAVFQVIASKNHRLSCCMLFKMLSEKQTKPFQNKNCKPFSLYLVLTILCEKHFPVNGQVPLTEFMPYKASDHANVISLGYDDKRQVGLGFTFNYYGQEYASVYIFSDGIVAFKRDVYYVGCMPLYTDLYPPAGGTVSYKISQDKAFLSRLSDDISKSSSEFQNLSMTNLFAATWNSVPHYENPTFRNTFQAVLTTDGVNSFVVFYYNKVEIPSDSIAHHDIFAYSELRNDNGTITHYLASAYDRNISAVLNSSNINVPGKWVFQVGSCASWMSHETTIGNTFHASALGQGALLIPINSSTCFSTYNTASVNCKFESLAEVSSTAGLLLAVNQLIICPLPLFFSSGNFSVGAVVTLTQNSSIMSKGFKFYMFVKGNENSVEPVNLTTKVINSGNIVMNASWNHEQLEIGGDFPCCGFDAGHTSIRLLKLREQSGRVDEVYISSDFENSGFYTGILDMSELLKEDSYSGGPAIAVQQTWKFNDSFVLRKQIIASRFETDKFLWNVQSVYQLEKMKHSSKYIPVFGNVPLLLRIPFTPKSLNEVKCNFIEANNNFQSSNGVILSNSEKQSLIMCPAPFFSSVGIVDIRVEIVDERSSEIFIHKLYAAREQDCDPENFPQLLVVNSNDKDHASLRVRLVTSWKSAFLAADVMNFINVSHADTQIVFYTYDEHFWEEIFESSSFFARGYTYVTTTSISKEDMLAILSSDNQIAVGIRETFQTTLGDKVSGVTFLRMKDAYSLIKDLKEFAGVKSSESGENAECKAWSELEEFSTRHALSCPKTVTQAKRDWKFIEDDHKSSFAMNEKTPFAFTQAIASDSGKGVLCLYNLNGTLSNKSHAERFSSTNRRNYWDHYFHDAIPYLHCCGVIVEEVNCKNFYMTKRAQEDGSNYSPPKFALAVSTGKFFPFDGEIRRVLGFGEFWVLMYTKKFFMNRRGKDTSFKMQVRLEQYVAVDGKAKPVSVITAVAMLDQNRHKKFLIQVSREKNNSELVIQLNKDKPLQLYSLPKQNHTQIFYFDQATIQYISSSGKLLVTFLSGFSVTVTTAGENEMGISLIVSATAEQFQNSSGLLVDKTTHRHKENQSKHVDVDSFEETESVDLQNTELVYANETLFVYRTDKPYSFYYWPNVTFKLPDTIDTKYGSKCKANPIIEGMMDLVLTGSESVANSTRDVTKYFADLYEE